MSILPNETTVQIDAPTAVGIHGKVGTVKTYDAFTKQYGVAMPHLGNKLSFVSEHEVVEIAPAAERKMTETNKRYAIRRYSDHRCIAWFTAESFDHFVGTTMVAFKDKFGAVHSVVNLEPGHYICMFDSDRDHG